MSIQVSPNAPIHEALQWTGDNASELVAAYILWIRFDPEVDSAATIGEAGELTIHFPNNYTTVEIPESGWLVSGPRWGAYGNGQPAIYTDSEFAARYTAA